MSDMDKWVAFPEVADRTDGVMTVGYTGLPVGLDPDRLQLNVHALRRGVIGWGGVGFLTLAAYRGEEDSYQVGTGVDAGGNAYGTGAVSVTKAESSQIKPASDSQLNAEDIRNGTLGVQWNITALNGRIEAHEQYDPAIRARQLDREIRRSTIRAVARANTLSVLEDRPLFGNLWWGGFDAWFMSEVAGDVINRNYPRAVGALVGRVAAMSGLIRGFRGVFNHHGATFADQIIDPLFWAMRPTRAAIASGVLATSRLVRPTPTDS